MNVTGIISAIGNNSSQYPLIVRDCGIEVPSKIYLTYKENGNDKQIQRLATRERFYDEYLGSAVWLGAIPLIERCGDFAIKRLGYNPDVNIKLFKEDDIQGLNFNIKKFEGKVSDEIINDLKKLTDIKKQKTYKNLLAMKFAAATLIPIALIGFILPKMIFSSSAKKIAELRKQKQENSTKSQQQNDLTQKFTNSQKKPTFTGNIAATLANFSTLEKMEIIDGGYALGRIVTARKGTDGNRNEAKDIAFKMAGMMYLNYLAPKQLERGLNIFSNKAFGLNTNLDPIMLADKKFIQNIKEGNIELPKSNEAKDLLDFVDNNPKSMFCQYANKFKKIKLLENGIRDPRAYVNTKELANFKKEIEDFAKSAISTKNVENFAKKAKGVKTFNILANVGLSSFLLAYCLPKAQFAFREFITGSKLDPGIVNANMEK